jgi:hypothetical protein
VYIPEVSITECILDAPPRGNFPSNHPIFVDDNTGEAMTWDDVKTLAKRLGAALQVRIDDQEI